MFSAESQGMFYRGIQLSMEILEEIANTIASLKRKDGRVLVAICGAADLGKTHLSMQLAFKLKQKGIEANHLTLDSYLMKRTDRINRGISGYQPGSHDLPLVKNDLKRFKKGQSIEYYPYEHSKGKKAASKDVIAPSPILIVDGLHSMNEQLTPYLDFSVFICTGDDQLKQIRHQADITKRHQTIEFSRAHADSEFEKYKQFVEPYKKQANVILFLKEKWNYILHNGAKS